MRIFTYLTCLDILSYTISFLHPREKHFHYLNILSGSLKNDIAHKR